VTTDSVSLVPYMVVPVGKYFSSVTGGSKVNMDWPHCANARNSEEQLLTKALFVSTSCADTQPYLA
jgi:hypothetical protein